MNELFYVSSILFHRTATRLESITLSKRLSDAPDPRQPRACLLIDKRDQSRLSSHVTSNMYLRRSGFVCPRFSTFQFPHFFSSLLSIHSRSHSSRRPCEMRRDHDGITW